MEPPDVPSQTDTYFFEEEGEMSISLKVAAGRLLKWNKKGREIATPRRGDWIEVNADTGKCIACKIGLVMIGRYGINKAQDYGGSDYGNGRLTATLRYGPVIACPVRGCSEHPTRRLGWVIEGLFEYHKWSVNRIDKWLAELAEEDND